MSEDGADDYADDFEVQETVQPSVKVTTPPVVGGAEPRASGADDKGAEARPSRTPPPLALPDINGPGSRRSSLQGASGSRRGSRSGQSGREDAGLASGASNRTPPLPAINGAPPAKSKIPSASPGSRVPPASGRSRLPRRAVSDLQGSPRERSSPKGDNGWNQYNKDTIKPRAQPLISGPSEEERQKRRMWAIEKRRRAEDKARQEAERLEAEEQRKRNAEQSKLEARRMSIRERIARQHEQAAKMAAEKAAADERARQELERFARGKPLYEKIMEEYEENKRLEDLEKKRQYDEEIARMKHVRPHQIIAGEVVVKPAPHTHHGRDEAPAGRDPSAGRLSRKSPARSSHPSQGAEGVPAAGASAREVAITAVPVKPQRKPGERERRRPDHARRHEPALMERAVSPFVFNSEQVPINVPDQAGFWPAKEQEQARVLDLRGQAPMVAVLEEADVPQMDSPSGDRPQSAKSGFGAHAEQGAGAAEGGGSAETEGELRRDEEAHQQLEEDDDGSAGHAAAARLSSLQQSPEAGQPEQEEQGEAGGPETAELGNAQQLQEEQESGVGADDQAPQVHTAETPALEDVADQAGGAEPSAAAEEQLGPEEEQEGEEQDEAAARAAAGPERGEEVGQQEGGAEGAEGAADDMAEAAVDGEGGVEGDGEDMAPEGAEPEAGAEAQELEAAGLDEESEQAGAACGEGTAEGEDGVEGPSAPLEGVEEAGDE